MTQQLRDATGAAVTVRLTENSPVASYSLAVEDRTDVGRADFLDVPAAAGAGSADSSESERIFFHTEVDPEHGGRGLGTALVRAALADSIRLGLTVVPVCPMFARYLAKNGEEFLADGGRFRRPTPADVALVTRTLR